MSLCFQSHTHKGETMLKEKLYVTALACIVTTAAFAQTAAHDALLTQFKSKSEPTAKDAIWTTESTFKVGVIDNGKNRDGYAAYVCQEAAAKGLKSVSVQIIDIAKLKNTGKWIKLGERRC